MGWLADEFGENRLRGRVILPTDEFFPGAYTGSEVDVRRVFAMLCAHMDVDPARVDFEFVVADPGSRRCWRACRGTRNAPPGRPGSTCAAAGAGSSPSTRGRPPIRWRWSPPSHTNSATSG
ncbi:hypothetical protein ACFQZ4_39190 [Catellatospora coxensis]